MSEEPAEAVRDPGGGAGGRRPVRARRNWLAVARKDFGDAGRSWQLYVLGGVFVAMVMIGGLQPVVGAMMGVSPPGMDEPPYAAQLGMKSMAALVEFIVPLVVLVLGHMSIVGERERGSLRALLALPVSRRDVIVGTLVGRTGVVWVTLLAGLAVAGVPMWLLYDTMDLFAYAGFGLSVLLFAGVFVGMAVGISAVSGTRGQAIGGAVTVFALVTFLWRLVMMLVEFATGVTPTQYSLAPDRAPSWYVFLERARPGEAWRIVVTDWIVPVMTEYGTGDDTYFLSPTTPGPEPFYLDTWFLALVLVAWGVVPLAAGYWRLRGADVG